MSSAVYNYIFSNVVATLSDSFLDQIAGNKREVLQDIIRTENVTLLVDSETACTFYSLSGLLDDVLLCQKKFAGLIQGENILYDETNDFGVPKNALDSNILTDGAEKNSGELETLVPVRGMSSDQINEVDEHLKKQVTTAKDKQQLQENKKTRRKRRKFHELQDEEKDVEIKQVSGIDEVITKRGRVVKRPSKLANSFVQLEKHLSGEKENISDSGSNEFQNQVDESDFNEGMHSYGRENDKDMKNKDDSGIAKVDVIGPDQVHKKPARKVVNLTVLKEEPDDKDFKEIKKKIRQQYENRMPFRYFCGKCSFKSKRESHYRKHMKLHEENPNLKLISCPLCNFTCIRQSLLKKHQICHELDGLSCGLCNFKTNSVKHVNQHMTNKHLTQKGEANKIRHPEIMSCGHCDFTTFDKTAFVRHVKTHVNSKRADTDPLYSCNLCSYSTRKRVLFDRHKKHVHSNTRPFLCDLCGAAFKRTDTLAAHKTTHLDISKRVLPFKCTKCPKAFKSRAHLRSHMYVHSSVKAFQCHICGQLFKTKQVQQKHIQNIHSNPRSFKCGTCQKDFNTKYTLQRHEKTHETEIIGEMKTDLSIYEQPMLKSGTGDKVFKDSLKLQQHGNNQNDNQAIVVEFNHGFNEAEEASSTLNEVQDHQNVIGKEDLVKQDETVDENISAIQHITLNEISQQLDNSADQFQSTNDIGTIYIEGLDSVMTENGAINIVNLDGQNIQQILIPRNSVGQSSVNISQFISQINPSLATPQSLLKGNNSDELSEVFVSTESLEKGDNSESLSEVYVSTVDIKDSNPTFVNASDIGKIYIESTDDFKEVKQVVVPSNFVTSAIERGEMVIVQDNVGENQTS